MNQSKVIPRTEKNHKLLVSPLCPPNIVLHERKAVPTASTEDRVQGEKWGGERWKSVSFQGQLFIL